MARTMRMETWSRHDGESLADPVRDVCASLYTDDELVAEVELTGEEAAAFTGLHEDAPVEPLLVAMFREQGVVRVEYDDHADDGLSSTGMTSRDRWHVTVE